MVVFLWGREGSERRRSSDQRPMYRTKDWKSRAWTGNTESSSTGYQPEIATTRRNLVVSSSCELSSPISRGRIMKRSKGVSRRLPSSFTEPRLHNKGTRLPCRSRDNAQGAAIAVNWNLAGNNFDHTDSPRTSRARACVR